MRWTDSTMMSTLRAQGAMILLGALAAVSIAVLGFFSRNFLLLVAGVILLIPITLLTMVTLGSGKASASSHVRAICSSFITFICFTIGFGFGYKVDKQGTETLFIPNTRSLFVIYVIVEIAMSGLIGFTLYQFFSKHQSQESNPLVQAELSKASIPVAKSATAISTAPQNLSTESNVLPQESTPQVRSPASALAPVASTDSMGELLKRSKAVGELVIQTNQGIIAVVKNALGSTMASVPSGAQIPLEPGKYTIEWKAPATSEAIDCPQKAEIERGSITKLTCELSVIPVPTPTALSTSSAH